MKLKKLLLVFFSSILFHSCTEDVFYEDPFTLGDLLSSYDLWYVDIHSKTGTADVPYISRAFTLSYWNGNLYANNNIAEIGYTGDGYGIQVGNYNTFGFELETYHVLDGMNYFEVVQVSQNEIRLYDLYQNVSYLLVGYSRNEFDYDRLFYDNIEYFLQEYEAWERTFISTTGTPNVFDYEHFLAFTPENINTFYSSRDEFGTDIDNLFWNFTGNYEIFDVQGYNDLKILTLNYGPDGYEEFELSVLNDQNIQLFHLSSGTTYEFRGRGFIQFLKNSKAPVRNNGRLRTKVERKEMNRKYLQ